MKKISLFMSLMIMLFVAMPLFAQKKLQKSPGGYHGELDFPLSFKRYYSYAEWTKIMHDIQKKYPHLSEVQSIGKSRMGRDQYVISITAKSTGGDMTKPAMWVDGALHGNEVNGISCSLYLMWYLLTRYDYDQYVHDLVNNCTFYISPGVNVDANDSYVAYPNTSNNPRETYRPEDNDGDGLYDEDQTEDVDGDGELSTMYMEDPKGEFKLSPDKRRFVQVADEKEEVKRFRRIGGEGYDNDGDGRINEDDIGGPDPNRNYPTGWSLRSGETYPLSEPETNNVYQFWLKHSNIFAGFNYHNAGRLIMFTAPSVVQEEEQSGSQQRRRGPQQTVEQILAELLKTNKYAQLFDRKVAPEYQHDMDVQTDIATMGARILKNYRPTPTGGSGMEVASLYGMFGAYAYLIELWGWPPLIYPNVDENDDGRLSDEEMLKWIDIELSGEGWINPHKFNHPDLGEIWIGGTVKKHISRTPPAQYIEMETLKNAQFVMYCASQFPKIEFEGISVLPATDDLFWLEIILKNDRTYPSISDRALQLKKVKKDKLILNLSKNITLVNISKGNINLDPVSYNRNFKAITSNETEFRLKGKQKLSYRALVKMTDSTGSVECRIVSKFGGKENKKINIKIDD